VGIVLLEIAFCADAFRLVGIDALKKKANSGELLLCPQKNRSLHPFYGKQQTAYCCGQASCPRRRVRHLKLVRADNARVTRPFYAKQILVAIDLYYLLC
jgi:hypothetical protein